MVNLQQLQDRREILRGEWSRFLGVGPTTKPALNTKKLAEEKINGCVRETVTFETHDGVLIPTYIIRPEKIDTPLPGILSFHQTTEDTIDEAGGVSGSPDLQIGLHLAEKGFVTVNPTNYLWNYKGLQRPESVDTLIKEYPNWKGMGKMIWDGMRGVDLLQSLPYVQSDRIGTIGHSLGGKEAFYLAAFDSRVKAAVASEMGLPLSTSNWYADHYLSEKIKNPDFNLTHHDILELIAPKPFMLVAGDCSDGPESEKYIKQAEAAYEAFGAKERISVFNHHKRHKFPLDAREKAYSWLLKYVIICIQMLFASYCTL